ncbi:hypothetical protein [Neobacillus niacini]|uniref:hypothetical protein n=1 Tax=Neobacillus niacini TaxID=86668 RepID=UPI002866F16E|nr:hypothetical protein [Neobacillus niacini]MDR7000417.1 hypothetical protein [Neobacillus niacini]
METIIFLIIIGVLSAVFGKAKGNRTPSKNKPFSFNQFEEFRELFSEKALPKQERPIKPVERQTHAVQQQNIEIKYQQVKHEAESITTRVSRVFENAKAEDVKPQVLEREDKNEILSDSTDAKSLINGIIWSEILGEPRARRPYFSRRR